jgi:hypothetical protein
MTCVRSAAREQDNVISRVAGTGASNPARGRTRILLLKLLCHPMRPLLSRQNQARQDNQRGAARNARNATYSQITNAERCPFPPCDLAVLRWTHARPEHEFSGARHNIYRLQSSAPIGDINDLAPDSAMTAPKDNSTVLQCLTARATTPIKRGILALRRLLLRSASSEPRPSEGRYFHFVLVQSPALAVEVN